MWKQKKAENVIWKFRFLAMISEVYLNGEKLYRHEGGYSLFRVKLTEKLQEKNVVAISVDNRENTICYPQKADFTFYGCLYCGINLVTVPKEHFALDYCGTPGLKVTPEVDLDTKTAQVTMEVWTEGNPEKVTISVIGQERESGRSYRKLCKNSF